MSSVKCQLSSVKCQVFNTDSVSIFEYVVQYQRHITQISISLYNIEIDQNWNRTFTIHPHLHHLKIWKSSNIPANHVNIPWKSSNIPKTYLHHMSNIPGLKYYLRPGGLPTTRCCQPVVLVLAYLSPNLSPNLSPRLVVMWLVQMLGHVILIG